MKKIIFILITLSIFIEAKAQIGLQSKIDTTNHETLRLYNFIKTYLHSDTISNEYWHPKFKNKKVYDYTMDWFFGKKIPKELTKYYNLELVELQNINDTLSYFKVLAKSKPEVLGENFSNVLKYYIVKINDRYYLDNCKDYDSRKFMRYAYRNINFYISPFYDIDKVKLKEANNQFDALCLSLKKPKPKKPIDYYMCSNEEELNNLSNIVIWNGGLSGYTNIPEGFIVAINDNPVYKHEFVHAILGSSSNCFFLQEGIAVLYGGMNKGAVNYEQGLAELKAYYKDEKCNFNNLYTRKVEQKYNSNLTYTFAAVFCKYLIDKYGLDYFYKIYYNQQITTNNFMEKISELTGISNQEIHAEIEKIILN